MMPLSFPLHIFLIFHLTVFTSSYRLERNVQPFQQSIELTVLPDYASSGTFTGYTAIVLFATNNDTQIVQLHQGNEITISSIQFLFTENGTTTDLYQNHSLNETTNILSINLTDTLIPYTYYDLCINYTATLSDDDFGFYRSSYEDSSGNTVWLAATQFQPSFARRAVPCFDEPHFKAIYTLILVRPSTQTALSNAPLLYTEAIAGDDTIVRDTFRNTPRMSIYLLAFVIANYTYLYEYDFDKGLSYAVWARQEVIQTGEYAMEVMPKLLNEMEEFTGYAYTSLGLNKLHQVAIPDFAAGAMENWGLVTYREVALLYDPEESTLRNKQQIATINTHEFAHMWFGNLVTCDWWSYAWLNEGFATYFQWLYTAKVETGFELDYQFILEAKQASMDSDSVISAESLTSEADTLSEILAKFNTLTYSKGASVIRMMELFLGTNNFQNALKQYLLNNAYSTVVPDDLWNEIESYTSDVSLPANISTIMGTWIDQPGHPVLTVSLQGSNVLISQRRFLFDPTAESSLNYYVPLTYTTSTSPNFTNTQATQWLLPSENITLSDLTLENDEWIILNIQSSGYYRVNYDSILWQRLLETLTSVNFSDIHILNRAQIIDDAFDLARANIISYNLMLNITTYLRQETEYYPWYAAFQGFSFLRQRFSGDSELSSLLDTYIAEDLMSDIQNSLSFSIDDNVTEITTIKQQLFLSWSCNLGNQQCVNQALEQFREFRTNEQTVNPNVRSTVYCSGLRNSNEPAEDWSFLYSRSLTTTSASERSLIYSALGCTRETSLLNHYLNLTIDSSSGIRSQDASSVFAAVYNGNPEGVSVAFEFFKNNHQAIIQNYGGINPMISLITGMASRLRTEEEINEFEAFFENNEVAIEGVNSLVSNAVQTARNNIEWANSNSDTVKQWLSENIVIIETSSATITKLSNIVAAFFTCFILRQLINNNL